LCIKTSNWFEYDFYTNIYFLKGLFENNALAYIEDMLFHSERLFGRIAEYDVVSFWRSLHVSLLFLNKRVTLFTKSDFAS